MSEFSRGVAALRKLDSMFGHRVEDPALALQQVERKVVEQAARLEMLKQQLCAWAFERGILEAADDEGRKLQLANEPLLIVEQTLKVQQPSRLVTT